MTCARVVRSRCVCFFTNDFCLMPTSDSQRQAQLRALIQTFLTERLNDKLDALKPDDPKRAIEEEKSVFALFHFP